MLLLSSAETTMLCPLPYVWNHCPTKTSICWDGILGIICRAHPPPNVTKLFLPNNSIFFSSDHSTESRNFAGFFKWSLSNCGWFLTWITLNKGVFIGVRERNPSPISTFLIVFMHTFVPAASKSFWSSDLVNQGSFFNLPTLFFAVRSRILHRRPERGRLTVDWQDLNRRILVFLIELKFSYCSNLLHEAQRYALWCVLAIHWTSPYLNYIVKCCTLYPATVKQWMKVFVSLDRLRFFPRIFQNFPFVSAISEWYIIVYFRFKVISY